VSIPIVTLIYSNCSLYLSSLFFWMTIPVVEIERRRRKTKVVVKHLKGKQLGKGGSESEESSLTFKPSAEETMQARVQ